LNNYELEKLSLDEQDMDQSGAKMVLVVRSDHKFTNLERITAGKRIEFNLYRNYSNPHIRI
jgi:hypothetical protein